MVCAVRAHFIETDLLLCTAAERPILRAELAALPTTKQQQIKFVDEDEDYIPIGFTGMGLVQYPKGCGGWM